MKNCNTKIKTAIISLTCCEGCQIVILDLGERLLELTEFLDLEYFPLGKELKGGEIKQQYDLALVEGAPITKENIETLKKLRENSKILIALGACAHLGGVAEIKNYGDKEKNIRYVYKNIEGIDNPDVKPISAYVKIDGAIPGCPIDKNEFVWFAKELKAGKTPKIPEQPVCYECQILENECLLQKGLPCFGPVTLGGCKAICPSNNFICEACRGPLKEINLASLKNILGDKMSDEELMKIAEIYGVKDDLEAKT